MLEPKKLPPMAGGQVTGGCPVDAFQQACVEVDVAIVPTAIVDPPAVRCIGEPQIGPIGSTFCPETETLCGFTVAQRLCIGTRVRFQATATPGEPRAFCDPPTFENCFSTCAFFEPRSQGFWGTHFDLTNFTVEQICGAAQCLRANSEFLNELLVACPAPGEACPTDPALIAPCIASVTALLTQAGAQAAITTQCPGLTMPQTIQLANALRQFVANWLNICFCTTTLTGEDVGGVQLDFRVDLSQFLAATLTALGLDGPCETVGDVLAVAENIFATCDFTRAALITPILGAMAQDPGATIIEPLPCP